MNFWLLPLVHLLAVMSPGPDFFLILKHSSLHSRREGLISAFGIACGCLIHMVTVTIVIFFVGKEVGWMSQLLRILGSGYLIYLGISSLNSYFHFFPSNPDPNEKEVEDEERNSGENQDENHEKIHNFEFKTYFLKGLFCNLLNPKVWAYFSSIFLNIVLEFSPLQIFSMIIIFYIITHLWFSLVSVLFTLPFLQSRLNRYRRVMPLLCGIAFCVFGVSLIWN